MCRRKMRDPRTPRFYRPVRPMLIFRPYGGGMDITHFGHSALLLSYAGEGGADACRILIDPGNLSDPRITELMDLDAIAVSHQHPDHAHPPFLEQLFENNPEATIILESQTASVLSGAPETSRFRERFTPLAPGGRASVGTLPVTVRAVGGAHATIHPAIPPVGNVAFIVEAPGERTFAHTGDSLVPHPDLMGVDVLSFPVVAPWSKMQETIDFLRIVKPSVAIPVHDRVASGQGRAIYLKQSRENAPEECEVRDWPADAEAEDGRTLRF